MEKRYEELSQRLDGFEATMTELIKESETERILDERMETKKMIEARGGNGLSLERWRIPLRANGAGSEIPSGFVQPGSDGLILEGPWIGVTICAVIYVDNVDVCMESKYTATAHIHLGGKHWKTIGWLSVKLALEQIVVKSRADDYSYKEMLQHLNDLEAAH
ncbi:hypothetical protein L1987_56879 [Smallanthus sonchifolius]|uniref:Uncharacterized protein n=1 Tax=Smallanthus sonchifolius TaxID=185202 RepID=A0ACB9DB65_9ASTR|nr:hypothetical protein L1987_56879 [Smallanthus sonchifolius]